MELLLWSCLLASVTYVLPAGATDANLRLELASIVFRHGDRSPIHTFPNDQYVESDWPQGYGQLSRTGMQQQYHLGELLKARYVNDSCDGFICSNYSRVQVQVRSTDVDRTLMSVESQLSALFPPGPNQTFESALPWQPIPIHTSPFGADQLLRPTDVCPAYIALLENSSLYQELDEENEDFFTWIGNLTGLIPFNMSNLWEIEDTLFIQNVSDGYCNPAWVDDHVLMKLHNLSSIAMSLMFDTKAKNRLTAGTWLGKVLYDMKNKTSPNGNQTVEDMKLYLYSAHDTTVAAMQSALQVFNKQQPGYASAFLVELYSDPSSNFFVKMFRRVGPYSDVFVPLNASYCAQGTTCTLQEFETFVTPLIPPDVVAECNSATPVTPAPVTPAPGGGSKENYQTLKITVIALGCCLSIALLTIIILIVVVLSVAKRKRSAQRLFTALNDDNQQDPLLA